MRYIIKSNLDILDEMFQRLNLNIFVYVVKVYTRFNRILYVYPKLTIFVEYFQLYLTLILIFEILVRMVGTGSKRNCDSGIIFRRLFKT